MLYLILFISTHILISSDTHILTSLGSFASFSVQRRFLTQCHLKASVICIVFPMIVNEDVEDDVKYCPH